MDNSHDQGPRIDQRLVINGWWLIKLRWVAVFGQLITVMVVAVWLQVEIRLLALLAIIAVTSVSNIALIAWYQSQRDQPWSERARLHWYRVLGGVMLLDLVSLTGLLYLTGGPANPFAVFYIVNMGLAAILLPARWAWLLEGFVLVCLALIFYDHLPIDVFGQPDRLSSLRSTGQISLIQQGMFVAYGTCTAVIVYFTTRLTAELRAREIALRQAEAQRARSQYLEALGTMAAGAAHELATPLGTIAVVARELELEILNLTNSAELRDDLQVIRIELDRCRTILNRMSIDAGQSIGEPLTEVSVEELMSLILAGVSNSDRVHVTYDQEVATRVLRIPCESVAQALRVLVQNGLDASQADSTIGIRISGDAARIDMSIEDTGSGMPPEVLRRVGEPFFTTKQPGRGMGLGVFLARSVIERLDGQLKIDSEVNAGTRVLVCLPCWTTKKEKT